MIGSAILAALILVFSGCGISQQPSNGVAQGYDNIYVVDGNEYRYDFSISAGYYGYFTIDNISGNLYISAPYGVYTSVNENLPTAPLEGYTSGEELYSSHYYIIRPDSLYYGKLYIESISYSDTAADISFQWWLQTRENVREL